MYPKARILLYTWLCAWIIPVWSQETSFNPLDTVSITTTRIFQPQTHTGRNITVIPAETFQKSPVLSIDEVLRYVPGVEVQQRGPMGAQADILIRGSTFSQVLVLIDGMRFNDPLTAHFNGYIPIPTSEIQRIEIMRGPAAALYGPDAVGGVINIITHTFNPIPTQPNWGGHAEIAHGEFGLWQGDGGVRYRADKWSIGIGGRYLETDGQVLPTGKRSDLLIKQASISGSLKLRDHMHLRVRSAWDYRLFNTQYYYTQSAADEARERVRNNWNQLQLIREKDRLRSELNFSYKIARDSFLFNPMFPANVHKTTYSNFQFIQHYQQSDQFSFSGGLQLDWRAIESSDRGDHEDWHRGIFLMGYYSPISDLGMTASLRGDWDENYGFEWSPQLNIAYEWRGWIMRGAVGRSIRAADFTERFISTELPGPLSGGRNIGNPALNAESAWSYEVGIEGQLVSGVYFKTGMFLRDGNDLIDYVLTPTSAISQSDNLLPDEIYFYTQNVQAVRTLGWEIEARWHSKIGTKGTSDLVLGYTLLDSEAPDGLLTKYVANHAQQLFTASWNATYDRWDISLNGLWKIRDPERAATIEFDLTQAYTVWNTRLRGAILRNHLYGYAQINNLFNAQYQDILGAKMPDRWILAGLQYKL